MSTLAQWGLIAAIITAANVLGFVGHCIARVIRDDRKDRVPYFTNCAYACAVGFLVAVIGR